MSELIGWQGGPPKKARLGPPPDSSSSHPVGQREQGDDAGRSLEVEELEAKLAEAKKDLEAEKAHYDQLRAQLVNAEMELESRTAQYTRTVQDLRREALMRSLPQHCWAAPRPERKSERMLDYRPVDA